LDLQVDHILGELIKAYRSDFVDVNQSELCLEIIRSRKVGKQARHIASPEKLNEFLLGDLFSSQRPHSLEVHHDVEVVSKELTEYPKLILFNVALL